MSSESASARVGTAIGPSVAGAAADGLVDGRPGLGGWAGRRDGVLQHGRRRLRPPAEGDRQRALLVGAPDGRPHLCEALEQRRRGVAVVVARTDADGGEAWPKGLEQGPAGGCGAAVVRDLEHVPATAVVLKDPEQVCVAVVLEVAGEQDPLAADVDAEHDRRVIDAATRGRGGGGQTIEGWPEDLDARRAQPEGVALDQPEPADPESLGCGSKFAHPRALAGHAGLRDATDAIAGHESCQAAGVVLVRVRQHHQVDAAIPDRDALVEALHEQVGVGPAVHEHALAVPRLEKDGIALPDVEDDDL